MERSLLLPSATKLRRLCFYRCVSVHREAVSQHALKGEGVPALGGCLVQGGAWSGGALSGEQGGAWSGAGGLVRVGAWSREGGGGGDCPPPPAYGYCCGRYVSYWNAFLYKYASHLHTRSLYMAVIKTDNALTVKVTWSILFLSQAFYGATHCNINKLWFFQHFFILSRLHVYF